MWPRSSISRTLQGSISAQIATTEMKMTNLTVRWNRILAVVSVDWYLVF